MQRGPADYGDFLTKYIQWAQSIFWLSFQACYRMIFLYTFQYSGFGYSRSAFWRGRVCSPYCQIAKEQLLTSVQKVCELNTAGWAQKGHKKYSERKEEDLLCSRCAAVGKNNPGHHGPVGFLQVTCVSPPKSSHTN